MSISAFDLDAAVEILAMRLAKVAQDRDSLLRRVDELLAANSQEVERRRELEREITCLRARLGGP